MNANQIKAQLAQVFENDYPGYECFVEKVINVIFTGDDAYEALTIPEEYLSDEKRQKAKESGILKILKVGEINTSEPIEVFDITLSDRKDLQYNRVGIQSFIRSELFMFTNAFMLFHNENPEGKDWRFSFAYKDTTIKGMTPAKRYTYLFGKNHRARTASERFAKLADAEKDTQNLLNAFSVEALSKDFFNGYKEQYKAFCDFLFAHKDDREYFGPKFSQWEDKYLRDYVKKMMGRITFIYFLQRKGWMNNDLDYMQKAFENSTCKDDYLDSFLEPLFCGVLNTKPEERAELFKSLGWNLSLLDGWNDIPYLNGGLFERDEQDKPKSKFPAQMFKNLFDFYSRYNFTIYENDPDDAEVGIDPEMLGHIFENLLEDNKDKGAFYTPKEIVQYMSRESIAQYLKTHADEALHTAIDELIKDGKVGEALQDKANATAIYKLLCDVKVCDPAIGSGAFPMGVLNVLYHARMLLYAFTRPTQGFSPASVKREIIQNNIYGVDIEKGAVDIARLRFWLALVVDEEEPQPLPNLDYKIMCGNSLIHRFALDAPFQNVLKHYNKENKTNITLDDYRQWVYDYTNLSDHTQKDKFRQKIEEIKSAFKTELSKGEKFKLSYARGEIDNLQAKDIFGKQVGSATEIKKMQKKLKELEAQRDDINNNKLYENAFEWRFEFPALLDKEGDFTGFDVVIGNPPYIKELGNEKIFAPVNNSPLGKKYHKGKMDYWYYFLHKAIDIIGKKGIISFITSRYWINSAGAEKVIKHVSKETDFINIVDIGKLKVFDNVVGYHMVYVLTKYKKDEDCHYFAISDDISNLENGIFICKRNIKQKNLYSKNYDEIILEDRTNLSITQILGDICNVSQGIVEASDKISSKMYKKNPLPNHTIGDGIFVLSLDEYNRLNLSSSEREIIKPYEDSGCISRYCIDYGKTRKLIYADAINRNKIAQDSMFSNIKSHLDNMSDYITSTYKPYGLHRARKYTDFTQPKIIGPSMFVKPSYTYDDQNLFVGMSYNIITPKNGTNLLFVLGIINSIYASNWFYSNAKHRGAGVDVGVDKLRTFPIPITTTEQQQPIIDLVDKILMLKKENSHADTSALEHEIDKKVEELYG